MPKFTERLQSAWNAFLSREPTRSYEGYGGFPLDLRGLVSFGVLYRF